MSASANLAGALISMESMMTEFSPRLFSDDAAIRRVGEGLLARSLPREDWTHEAHLAACTWLVRERPEIDLESDLPEIIRSYNVAVGGINDDAQGYHETLTQHYIATVRAFVADSGFEALVDCVNALLVAPEGRRDWPLSFYSPETLFSVAARRGFVRPDLAPLEKGAK
jgi:hypothetical protein